MTIDPRVLELARENLTSRQNLMWRYHIGGYSQRQIALALDVSRTTVVDTLDASWRKLRAHGVYVTPDGRPHLKETA